MNLLMDMNNQKKNVPNVSKVLNPDSNTTKTTTTGARARVYNCDQCEHVAKDYADLTRHKSNEHPIVLIPESPDEDTLKRHIETVHDGKRHYCNQCEYSRKQKSVIKTHIESVHNGNWHYCDQCEYKAAKKCVCS